MSAAFVLLCAAVAGGATMVAELTAVRTLQPFFGSTTIVWTNVIAVTLAALAAGGLLGGALADRRPSAPVFLSLLAAGGVLLAFAAVAVSETALLFLDEGLDLDGLASFAAKGSLATTAAVFAPAFVCLGAAAPFAARLSTAAGAGRAAGRVWAASTAASVAGAYAATLVLVPAVGSRWTVLGAGASAAIVASAGLARLGCGRRAAAAALSVAVAAMLTNAPEIRERPPLRHRGNARVIEERESPYQYLAVREDWYPHGETDTVLTINEGVYVFHSLAVKGRVLTGSRHYDDYTVLPLLLDGDDGDPLSLGVVGFACGINAAQWRHFWGPRRKLTVAGAEIDPDVLAIARSRFGLVAPEDGGPAAVAADGRAWLAALPAGPRFHVLVVDAFANEIYMPFHLGTREFFELAKSRLATDGIVAMNVYAEGTDAPNLRALEATLASVFGSVVRSRREGGGFLVVARGGGAPLDLDRLRSTAIYRRLGEGAGLAEWDDFVLLASRVGDAAEVADTTGGRVLTDDDAPLEDMTDRFRRQGEDRFLRGEGGAPLDEDAAARRERALALSSRQDALLAAIAGAWLVLLAAAAVAVRRA